MHNSEDELEFSFSFHSVRHANSLITYYLITPVGELIMCSCLFSTPKMQQSHNSNIGLFSLLSVSQKLCTQAVWVGSVLPYSYIDCADVVDEILHSKQIAKCENIKKIKTCD